MYTRIFVLQLTIESKFTISVNNLNFSTFKSPEPGFYTAPPTGSLSFAFEDEEYESTDDDDEEKVDLSKFKKFKKNPNVDTSFLPDAVRDVSLLVHCCSSSVWL